MKKIILASILIFAALTFVLITHSKSQSLSSRYLVKLYSGDKVVATWEAKEIGKIEGQSLIFTSGSDLNPKMVRIQGSFSVEEM